MAVLAVVAATTAAVAAAAQHADASAGGMTEVATANRAAETSSMGNCNIHVGFSSALYSRLARAHQKITR